MSAIPRSRRPGGPALPWQSGCGRVARSMSSGAVELASEFDNAKSIIAIACGEALPASAADVPSIEQCLGHDLHSHRDHSSGHHMDKPSAHARAGLVPSTRMLHTQKLPYLQYNNALSQTPTCGAGLRWGQAHNHLVNVRQSVPYLRASTGALHSVQCQCLEVPICQWAVVRRRRMCRNACDGLRQLDQQRVQLWVSQCGFEEGGVLDKWSNVAAPARTVSQLFAQRASCAWPHRSSCPCTRSRRRRVAAARGRTRKKTRQRWPRPARALAQKHPSGMADEMNRQLGGSGAVRCHTDGGQWYRHVCQFALFHTQQHGEASFAGMDMDMDERRAQDGAAQAAAAGRAVVRLEPAERRHDGRLLQGLRVGCGQFGRGGRRAT